MAVQDAPGREIAAGAPREVAELTPAWLQQVLAGALDAAEIASISCETIGVGAGFMGELARVLHDERFRWADVIAPPGPRLAL